MLTEKLADETSSFSSRVKGYAVTA